MKGVIALLPLKGAYGLMVNLGSSMIAYTNLSSHPKLWASYPPS